MDILGPQNAEIWLFAVKVVYFLKSLFCQVLPEWAFYGRKMLTIRLFFTLKSGHFLTSKSGHSEFRMVPMLSLPRCRIFLRIRTVDAQLRKPQKEFENQAIFGVPSVRKKLNKCHGFQASCFDFARWIYAFVHDLRKTLQLKGLHSFSHPDSYQIGKILIFLYGHNLIFRQMAQITPCMLSFDGKCKCTIK